MRPVIYRADSLFHGTTPPLGDYGRRLLAEGDSWFTIGTIRLPQSSNVLQEFEFSRSTAIVTAAYPGDTMKRMVDGGERSVLRSACCAAGRMPRSGRRS